MQRILTMVCGTLLMPVLAMAQAQPPAGTGDMPGMRMPSQQPMRGTSSGTTSGQQHDHHVMQPSAMPGMTGMQHGAAQSSNADPGSMPSDQQGAGGMQMGPMQGGKPPPDARDPDAYAEGTQGSSLGGMEMNDNARFGRFLVDRLEFVDGRDSHGHDLEAEAWYGNDYNKLWVKAEGGRREGRLTDARTEVLWDRVFATFWSTQLGVRHDSGEGPGRNWLAFGVQGLAPYWFETEATAYIGNRGTLAMRGALKYEVLFTQRLILQPDLEVNLYSKSDPERGIGSGLSDARFGLRLRYEIRRQFAPYVGIAWRSTYGGTADFARRAGERASDRELVAGVRLWF